MSKKFIRVATQHAKRSPSTYQLAAICFKGGRILSISCNEGLQHAEERCIRKLKKKSGRDISGVNMMIIRIQANDNLSLAKPCSNCLKIIQSNNINKIYYTDWDGNLIIERACDMTTTHMSVGQRSIM